jgi:hypothetical protein
MQTIQVEIQFFVIVVLEFELRALCLLGKHFTIWAKSPALFIGIQNLLDAKHDGAHL